MTTYILDALLTTSEHISFQLTLEADTHAVIEAVQRFLDGKLSTLGNMALNRNTIVSVTVAQSFPMKDGGA